MNSTRNARATPSAAKTRNASKYASADACCSRRLSSDCNAICCAATGSPLRLEERRLRLREEGVHRRVERVELLVEPQRVEILAPLRDRLADGDAHAAALVAQQRQQPHRRPAQLARDVEIRRHVERREHEAQPRDQHHARPDDLPGRDVEVQARQPEIARAEHDAARRRSASARPSPRPSSAADDDQRRDGEKPRRREHQPGVERIVAKERLQHRRQQRARAVQHPVGAEDDQAGDAEIAVAQRPEIDDRRSAGAIPTSTAPAPPRISNSSSVCTRPKGSPSQSHSWPLLRSTSQHTSASTSSLRPMESKRVGCFLRLRALRASGTPGPAR